MEKRISALVDRTEKIILKGATKEKKEKLRNTTEGLSTEKKVKSSVSLEFQKEKIKSRVRINIQDSDNG